ncbi:MAG: hypothetical protein R3F28_01370 [Candidatus Kapaibacterium sp.]
MYRREIFSALFLLVFTSTYLFTQPITDSQGDVGIGTISPDPSALFELRSTTKGFLMPRMTSTQRNAISDPATGLMIYNTEDSVIQWNWGTEFSPLWYTVVGVDTAGRLVAQLSPGAIWYGNLDSNATELPIGNPGDFLRVNSIGTAPEWISASAAPFWGLNGNGGTTPGVNYVGTSDDVDFVLATNGTERGRFYSSTNGGGFGITGSFRPNGDPGTTNQVLTSQGSSSPPAWSSDLNVDNITASGNATVGGDFDVDGATTLDDVTVDGNVVIDGDLSNTGNAVIASDPGSNATVGNTTGTTTVQGSTTNVDGDDVNVGSTATTIDIGNAGSTTTLDGTVVFTNAPELPLSEDALFVGNSLDVATELPTTNDEGAVLQQDASGTPIWSSDLNVDNIAVSGDLDVDGTTTLDDVTVDGTQTNTGDVSFTGTSFTTSGGTTSTFNGPVNINSDVVIDGDLSNTGNAVIASDPGSNATVGNTTGTTTVQGSTTNVDGNDVNVGSTATTIDIGNAGSTTTLDGTVVFTNAPELPLSEDALFVGNSLDVATELPTTNDEGAVLQQDASGTPIWSSDLNVDNIAVSGDLDVDGTTTLDDVTVDGNVVIDGDLSNTGNAVIASDPGSNATVGNTTGTTTVQGSTTNVDGNDVNVGSTATTIDIGNAGSTTTIDGTVVFTNALELPLSEDALFVGNSLNVAAELPTTNDEGAVLQQDASGTPIWSSDLNVDNIAVSGDLDVDGTTTLDDVTVDGNVVIDGDLSNTGNAVIASDPGSNATVGNTTGTTTVQGSTTNVDGNDVNIGSTATTIDIGNAGSTTTIDGTVVFTNAPELPLSEDALFVGNSLDVAAELPTTNDEGAVLQQDASGTPIWSSDLNVDNIAVSGDLDVDGTTTLDDVTVDGNVVIDGDLSNTGNAVIASDPGSNATVGNTTGTTTVQGSTTNVDGNDVNIGSTATTIDIGNAGSTTTIDGTVVFTNALELPLSEDALFVGNSLDVAAELPTTNDEGAVLQQDASGTPIWSSDLNVDNIAVSGDLDVDGATTLDDVTVDGTQTNTGDVSFTGTSFTTSGGTTSTFNGPVNINSDVVIDGDLSNTGNAVIASDPGSNATVGNTTGTTTVQGSTTNVDGNDVNVGSTATTIDIGNAGSTTTIDGTVVFTNAPSIPLTLNNIWVGDGSNVQAELTPGTNGQVLTVVAGAPTWATAVSGGVVTDATLTGDGTGGNPLGIDLTNANSWTGTQTFSGVDVNGGSIDGTSIGSTTPSTGAFTTLGSTGATSLGDGDDNVTLNVGTGELVLTGIDADAAPTSVLTLNGSDQVRETSLSDLATELSDQISITTDATLTGDGTTGSPLGIDLANANSWTGTQTFSGVDVNGGSIDGTSIGSTTPSTGAFTTLGSTGATSLGDGDDNVTLNVGTGELVLTGIDADAAPTSVLTLNGSDQVRETSLSDLATELSDQISITTDATLTGDGTTGSPLGIDLANANSWTGTQTFSGVDVNGGSIDGTSIGSTTPSTGAFTTLGSTGATSLGDGDDNVTLNVGTGELVLTGIDADAAPTSVLTLNGSDQVRETSLSDLATELSDQISITTDATLTGDGTTGSPLGIDLANANSWTGTQTFSGVDVNGGSIDGTSIGSTTPSTGAFTTLNANSTTTLGDGNGDNITLDVSDATTGGTLSVDVTNGTLDIDGLTQDNSLTNILVIDGTGGVGSSTRDELE